LLCLVPHPDLSYLSLRPLRQGGFVFLLWAKERANHMYAALFSYVGKRGVLCRRVGGRLDGPCRDPAIMAYLVPEQG
jgi:hypothetical protein